jgi:hypothetical protein
MPLMNVLYQTIATRILLALFTEIIRLIQENPRTGFKKMKENVLWKSITHKYRALLTQFAQAAREGWDDDQLRARFFEPIANEMLLHLRMCIVQGKMKQPQLQVLYDKYRTRPGLRDLTEVDFYLFVAYTACQP